MKVLTVLFCLAHFLTEPIYAQENQPQSLEVYYLPDSFMVDEAHLIQNYIHSDASVSFRSGDAFYFVVPIDSSLASSKELYFQIPNLGNLRQIWISGNKIMERTYNVNQGGRNHDLKINPEQIVYGNYLIFQYTVLMGSGEVDALTCLISTTPIEKNWSIEKIVFELPLLFYVGLTLALIIFSFTIYNSSSRQDFLWYGLYLIFLTLYLSHKSDVIITLFLTWGRYNQYVLHEVSQILINICYLFFVKTFLDTKTNYVLLNKLIDWITAALILFLLFDLFNLVSGYFIDIQSVLMNVHRGLMTLFALIGITYLIFGARDKLAYFIIVGSAWFVGGAVTTWISGAIHYMVYGAAAENLVFALGLGYKIKKLETSKREAEKRVIEARMTALRTQMNPHFIFNSLSAIKNLILQKKNKLSLKYLDKFSHLLRQILEASANQRTTLAEEINLLKLYLDIEKLRFENDFEYTINVDGSIEAQDLEVPLLMIQPFVENALVHGLLPKSKGVRRLEVVIENGDENYIHCIVEDNGVGRNSAANKKRKKLPHQQSRGVATVQQRLQLLNLIHGKESKIEIYDLVGDKGRAKGTRVVVKIAKLSN
ncbi:sensor histidine kinase [Psychroflexus tropicus]|uniref:sensor histidine kinase n=1 Tax=Psychroflexus tropicus TaxID=197345 RepID=UPI000365370E|nr:histidine kinase [Psychroflexus tropicus]